MKNWLFFFTIMLTSVSFTMAQDVMLPRKSPKASCSYTIGLTDVKVTYGAPAVNGRVIWGGLVPYNQIWRAGANEATTVEFSTDVNVEGQALKAGKYALFLIPGEKEWTVIFNKNADQWGAYNYKQEDDAIRVTVEPKMNEASQERLTYAINDMKMDMGYIKLAWEKMRLYIRFKTDVVQQAMNNIFNVLDTIPEQRKWMVYTQGAEFLMEADANLDQALDWAKKSTDRWNSSWNWYVLGEIQAKKGDMAAAVASGEKSIEFGMANDKDDYYKEHAEEIAKAREAWATPKN
ncbi:MAG TPA: DUF2911 domain-containing protein [Saprospiraceae bacterium]|nr:DUF2911 domain-containing protein [Saprospiraceae bacterium]